MQISTPSQTSGLSTEVNSVTPHERGAVENLSIENQGFWGEKRAAAQKKNKLGVFAKLLEGLSQSGNAKKDAHFNSPGVKSAEENDAGVNLVEGKTGVVRAGNKQKAEGLLADEKKPLKAGLKNAPESFFDAEDSPERLLAFFNRFPAEQDSSGENGLFRNVQKAQKNQNSQKGENSSPELMENAADGLLSYPEVPVLDVEALGKELRQGTAGKKTSRSERFLNVSFREMEAEFSRLKSAENYSGVVSNHGAGEKSKLDEARGKKGKERFNIEVRDLRTEKAGEASHTLTGIPAESGGKTVNSARPLSAEMEIPVDLDLTGRPDGGEAKSAVGQSSQGWTFEDALAKELRGGLSTDIVRDATVIVRNGGEGTIKLSLRPESLGDVKIRLEMTENKITGRIIVESSEALRAFERELPVLEKAFRDSGFSETNLEMSLAWGGENSGSQEQPERDFLNQAIAASRYDVEADRAGIYRTEEPAFSDGILSASGLSGSAAVARPVRASVNLLV
jgi:hypothetical protein